MSEDKRGGAIPSLIEGVPEQGAADQQRLRAFVTDSPQGAYRYELLEPMPTTIPPQDQLDWIVARAVLAEANDAYARMVDHDGSEAIIGRRLAQLHPDPQGDRRALLAAWIEAGYQFNGLEHCERNQDGRTRCFQHTGFGVIEAGKLVRFWGTQIEVTEHRRAEESLRESKLRYRTLLEHAPVGIWEAAPDGSGGFANARLAEIMGLEREEMAGAGWAAALHPEDRGRVHEAWVDFVGGRAPYHLSYRFVHRDGQLRWVIGQAQRLLNAKQEPIGFIGTMTDITERKQNEEERRQLESQLRRIQKLESLGTLAGGIAHDFNNILAAVLSYAELARDELPAESNAADDLDQIRQAALRASQLVEQILTFARQAEQVRSPVRLHGIVVEALRLLRAAIPTNIEIRQQIDPGCDPVLADPSHIHQVIVNLCTNANHAMRGRSGVLEVSLRQVTDVSVEPALRAGEASGPRVILAVRDSGAGMSKAVQARIFEPYYSTKPRHEGTGLGLAVVYGIMQSCGGEIQVTSEPGKGTTFTLMFPPAGSDAAVAREGPLELPRGEGEAIVIVDDEALVRQAKQRILSDLGYRTTTFSNGADALRSILDGSTDIDLLLTDMSMPHLTGLELAQAATEALPDLPVILVTGFSESTTPEALRQAGVNALLMKPIQRTRLAQEVREALGERP